MKRQALERYASGGEICVSNLRVLSDRNCSADTPPCDVSYVASSMSLSAFCDLPAHGLGVSIRIYTTLLVGAAVLVWLQGLTRLEVWRIRW